MTDYPDNEAEQSAQRSGALPVRLEVEYPERLSRPLLFVKWLLVIPLYIALIFYGVAAMVVGFIAFWAVLILGRFPEGMFSFVSGYMAYSYKTIAYFPLLLTDRWDTSDRASVRVGDEDIALYDQHPVDFQVDYPERLSPLILIFAKLPSYLLGVAPSIAIVAGFLLLMVTIPTWFIILVSGKYPKSLFRFSLSLLNWASRVAAWQWLMRDDWSLFGTTRPVQVTAALGAAAFLFFGLSPWLSLSIPGAARSPGPLTVLGASVLEGTQAVDEAQAVIEAFMVAGRSGDVDAAVGLTISERWRSQVQDMLSCEPNLFSGFLSARHTESERRGNLLVLRGGLTYDSGPEERLRADLLKRPAGWRIRALGTNLDRSQGWENDDPCPRWRVKPPPAPLPAIALSAGGDRTCAITTESGVRCWPSLSAGRVGDGTAILRTTPEDVPGLTGDIASVSVGQFHTCVVPNDGAPKCWGGNRHAQAGDWTTVRPGVYLGYRSTAGDVSGLTSNVISVAAGASHTCALTAAGSVWCWGDNYHGQLGGGNFHAPSAPVAVMGLTSGVADVSVGDVHSCALTTTGAVKCWGKHEYGRLGGALSSSVPADVTGLSRGIAVVSAGGTHTCALTTAGAVKCGGLNNDGQLGDGTSTQSTRFW